MEENQKNEKNNQKVEYRVLKEGEKDDPDGYLASFPPGYRFCPTDEELIIHYLKPKYLDQLLPITCIKTVNLYQKTPEELTEEFKLQRELEWYFITTLISGLSTQERQAGNGYWRTDGSTDDKPIYSDGQLVGYKRPWVFYIESSRSTWRMQEYRVHKESDTSSTANVKQDDWILCEIYNMVSDMPNKEEKNLQQEDGKMSTRVPDGVPITGPKMQNEDPLQLCLGHQSSGQQSSSSEVPACEEYFDSLPPGYRFCPTDEELIVHYVKPKNSIESLPINRIPIADIYLSHPQLLTDTNKPLREKEWYFFTTTTLRGESGRLQNRAAGNGSWTRGGVEKEISSNGERVGFRKTLIYYEKKSATNWRMYEYISAEESAPTSTVHRGMKVSDWILCNIHNWQEHKVETKRRRIDKGTARIDKGTENADAEEEPNKEPDKVQMIRFL